jgi:hypothetical protein
MKNHFKEETKLFTNDVKDGNKEWLSHIGVEQEDGKTIYQLTNDFSSFPNGLFA